MTADVLAVPSSADGQLRQGMQNAAAICDDRAAACREAASNCSDEGGFRHWDAACEESRNCAALIRHALRALSPDPTPTAAEREGVAEARWNALMHAAEDVATCWAILNTVRTPETAAALTTSMAGLTQALEAWPGDEVPRFEDAKPATEIALGHGTVYVGPVSRGGRVGLLLQPIDEAKPVGSAANTEPEDYQLQAGDVVIWLDGPERGENVIRELALLSAPVSGTGTREIQCQAWAPVNDREGLIDNESVGRSESQANRAFLKGWPGGWPQARAAGWRPSRVTITASALSRGPEREAE